MADGWTTVLGVNVIIWLGIAGYFFILDRKIKRLEALMEGLKDKDTV